MKLEIHPRIVANFAVDSAKIVFGSLVIGVFVPSANALEFPSNTFLSGLIITVIFLVVANTAARKEDKIKINQLTQ